MGRVCQTVGWGIILLPLLPLAWAANRYFESGGDTATFVSAATFATPLVFTMVGGVAMLTLGKLLEEISELRQSARYATQLLAEIADNKR